MLAIILPLMALMPLMPPPLLDIFSDAAADMPADADATLRCHLRRLRSCHIAMPLAAADMLLCFDVMLSIRCYADVFITAFSPFRR